MNVPNFPYLASLRTPGPCELCGAWCKMRCGAHVFSVGAGRVDHPINVVQTAIDPFSDCSCHVRSHGDQTVPRERFLEAVSKREGIPADSIKPIIDAVRACPRRSTFAAASVWLREKFEQSVAEAAIGIIEKVYKI